MKKTEFKNINEARKWFGESQFNFLIDYYTEIPFRPYGSGATRANILPVLKKMQPGFVLVYAKGHSGRTTFNSSLKTEHPMLAQDVPAFFREITRETSVKLFLYYSGIIDGVAGLRHPEWRMTRRDGSQANVIDNTFWMSANCPQSGYFENWVAIHFEEMITRYDPDGFWIDGDWAGPCYCQKCQARFREETGYKGPMPLETDETPEAIAWRQCWNRITYEWRSKFEKLIHSLKPTCLYSAGNVNPKTEMDKVLDWRSGDCYSPRNHRLRLSTTMRYYTTHSRPYDIMTCDTQSLGTKQVRCRSKTLPRMLQEGAGILANGGQWCYWTYPMPNGALVPSKMRTAYAAAEFARERKHISLNTESIHWTAILDSEPRFDRLPHLEANIYGAGKALIFSHLSPDIIDGTGITDDLPYDLVVIPEQVVIAPAIVRKLESFVRKGGKLLSSGASIMSPELQKLLGVNLVQRKALNEGHVFMKNGNPAGIYAPWDKLELKEAKELYPLYLSWDQFNADMQARFPENYQITGMVDEENPEPAKMPGATIRHLGKGVAAHIPTDIFSVYWKYGYPEVLAWLKEILKTLQPDPLFKTDALSFVEVALRRRGKDLLIHFINGNPGRDLSCEAGTDLFVDDIPSVGPITGWIKCQHKPGKACWEPGEIPAEIEWQNGRLQFVLPRLEIHTCLLIKSYYPN